MRPKDMRLIQLCVPGRLLRDGIEIRIDGAQRGWLCAVVLLVTEVGVIVVAEPLVHTKSQYPLRSESGWNGLVFCRASLRRRIEPGQHQCVTGTAIRDRHRCASARSIQPQIQHALVHREFRRLLRLHVGEYRIRECGCRRRYGVNVRKKKPKPLGIEEEESLVFTDRTPERAGPLVCVRERTWIAVEVVE